MEHGQAAAWSEEQVTLATKAASILSRIGGAPKVAFERGSAKNREGLEKVVRWFHATAAKPECLAAMIFTMDDGPYAGLPHEGTEVLATSQVKELDEHVQLRLARVDLAEEPWVLQCVRDGELAWSRVLSGAPDGKVAGARFVEAPAKALGSHGWKVALSVDWTYGTEQAHLYVDAKGGMLFYFLSW